MKDTYTEADLKELFTMTRDSSPRSRRWCFTLNNPPAGLCLVSKQKHSYIVVGREVGESGTPHLQGYVEFTNPVTLNWLKTHFCDGPHYEVAKGNSLQASDYCKKDGVFTEDGERSLTPDEKGAGEKRRWEDAFAAAKEGKLDEIPDEMRVRYYNTWKNIAKDFMGHPADLDTVCGIWLYGESGNGKSHHARQIAGPVYYEKMANKWWDGYQHEDVVIIDDLDPNHAVLGHHLKIWADKYAFVAECKGYAARIRPKKIIVTSQYPINKVFPDMETCAALSRRFQEIYVHDHRYFKPNPFTLEHPMDLCEDTRDVPPAPREKRRIAPEFLGPSTGVYAPGFEPPKDN